MVKVRLASRIQRELPKIAVIKIQGKECCVKLKGELTGKSGLARAGTASDPDYQGLYQKLS